MNSCFELAKDIKTLDINDPEWENIVACKMKKLIHGEKLTVYYRVFLDMKYAPRRPRAFKKHVKWMVEEWIKIQIGTHTAFAAKSWREQIYGLFDWKKQ